VTGTNRSSNEVKILLSLVNALSEEVDLSTMEPQEQSTHGSSRDRECNRLAAMFEKAVPFPSLQIRTSRRDSGIRGFPSYRIVCAAAATVEKFVRCAQVFRKPHFR
jgi:hypothetical protein